MNPYKIVLALILVKPKKMQSIFWYFGIIEKLGRATVFWTVDPGFESRQERNEHSDKYLFLRCSRHFVNSKPTFLLYLHNKLVVFLGQVFVLPGRAMARSRLFVQSVPRPSPNNLFRMLAQTRGN